jgi:hypothetical protein
MSHVRAGSESKRKHKAQGSYIEEDKDVELRLEQPTIPLAVDQVRSLVLSACCMCAVSDVIPRHVCRARGGGTTWSRRGRPARRSGGGPWRARSVGCR